MINENVKNWLAGEQAKLLEADGIEVADGRVDLEKYQWRLLDPMSKG